MTTVFTLTLGDIFTVVFIVLFLAGWAGLYAWLIHSRRRCYHTPLPIGAKTICKECGKRL